jgi:LPXTG-motif cell wall-anchored protein
MGWIIIGGISVLTIASWGYLYWKKKQVSEDELEEMLKAYAEYVGS